MNPHQYLPCPNLGLFKHGDLVFLPVLFPFFFFNHRLCGSNPTESVVCSFVQAAGRVNMGAVWLSFHVLLCSGVYAGLLDTLL